MSIIERPGEAMSKLYWHLPPSPLPINTQLVVGDKECVVATLNGAILGVIPTGSHWLHPQPFPFLVSSIDSQSNIRAEMWFVLTCEVGGIQCGGSLGTMFDEQTSLECAPRAFLEMSLKVTDPARFVVGVMGQTIDVDALLAYAKGKVMNAAKAVVGEALAGGMSVINPKLSRHLTDNLPTRTTGLADMGLAVASVHSATINLSEDDMNAAKKAMGAKAEAQRQAAMQAAQAPAQPAASARCGNCGAPSGGGRFCTACGGALHA